MKVLRLENDEVNGLPNDYRYLPNTDERDLSILHILESLCL